MIAAVLDHLWQSTAVAVAVGILVLAFRGAPAGVRHGLWVAASAKFLIPFAALAAVGRLLAPAVRPPPAAAPDAVLIERATQPFSQSLAAAPAVHATATAVHAGWRFDLPMALVGLWAVGCAAVLVLWMVRWGRVRSAVRWATPLPWPAPMPVLASASMPEPGLVGLRRPVLVVPQALPERLSRSEIDALVAHEACHLRRRDNLTGAIHMLVEALFWFHPLVWWIGARLIEERERACDEEVVGAGHDRAAYARCLVETCRLFLQPPLPCVAGASGSDLTRRVERIMTLPASAPLSRAGKTLLLAAGACALATPVAAGWLASPQGQEAATHVAVMASRALAARSADPLPAGAASALAPAPHGHPVKTILAARDRASPAPGQEEAPAAPLPAAASAPLPAEPAAKLSLARTTKVQLSKASLIPVANVSLPEADQPLGPGHYVQQSGLKKSGDCSDTANGLPPPRYALSTPPIAPGHVIANFHYGLQGDNRCDPRPPWELGNAECDVVTDRPDRKTVEFRLRTNGDYCFSYRAFEQDGPVHDNEAHGVVTQQGAVTRSRMVFSYDVR